MKIERVVRLARCAEKPQRDAEIPFSLSRIYFSKFAIVPAI